MSAAAKHFHARFVSRDGLALGAAEIMIRIHHRAVDDSDLKEMKEGRGSLGRNIVTITLPIAVVLFTVFYWMFRSLLVAILISGLAFFGSVVSNVRFFRKVHARKASRAD